MIHVKSKPGLEVSISHRLLKKAAQQTNYCARCQTGGKILADRALSRLLHKSWPRNIDELE